MPFDFAFATADGRVGYQLYPPRRVLLLLLLPPPVAIALLTRRGCLRRRLRNDIKAPGARVGKAANKFLFPPSLGEYNRRGVFAPWQGLWPVS